jgi:hypothetical protein
LQIKTPAQLEAAFSFLSSTASESFELKEFEEACGVGKLSLSSYALGSCYVVIIAFLFLGVSVCFTYISSLFLRLLKWLTHSEWFCTIS